MRKDDSVSLGLLEDFSTFCKGHPELRFWQALRAWAKADKIYIERYVNDVEDSVLLDTYYFKGKTR